MTDDPLVLAMWANEGYDPREQESWDNAKKRVKGDLSTPPFAGTLDSDTPKSLQISGFRKRPFETIGVDNHPKGELRMSSTKKSTVEVEGAEGIPVELIHDQDPATTFLPMRYDVDWAIADLTRHPDPGAPEAVPNLLKLKAAGVEALPLYESSATGLRWRVVA